MVQLNEDERVWVCFEIERVQNAHAVQRLWTNCWPGRRVPTIHASGRSRQTVDRVLSQINLSKHEIFVHFHSNLEILTGFQKPCDLVWIRHCMRYPIVTENACSIVLA